MLTRTRTIIALHLAKRGGFVFRTQFHSSRLRPGPEPQVLTWKTGVAIAQPQIPEECHHAVESLAGHRGCSRPPLWAGPGRARSRLGRDRPGPARPGALYHPWAETMPLACGGGRCESCSGLEFSLDGGGPGAVAPKFPLSVLSLSSQLASGTFIPKCLRKKLLLFPLQTQVRPWLVPGGGGGAVTPGPVCTSLATHPLSPQGSALKFASPV